jgi:hypothetical protein
MFCDRSAVDGCDENSAASLDSIFLVLHALEEKIRQRTCECCALWFILRQKDL